jgi:hypothetical protein
MALLIISLNSNAAELQHHFSSPAFSGIGYSSHVLTIKQLEDQQREKNQAKADAEKAKAEADLLNTPQARFIANLESRVYAQLAKQLTDSMFGEGATCTTRGIVCGSIPDLGGNTITWKLGDGSDSSYIIISIVNTYCKITSKCCGSNCGINTNSSANCTVSI